MRASWAGRGRAPSGVYVALGTLSVCVVLRVQANRNDTSDRGLGSAAESTLSGMGRPCRWALVARGGCGWVERVEIFQLRYVPRRFTRVGQSRCGAGGAVRGPGAGRFVRCLGSLPLCVVFLVQANGNDTSDRCLGSAAESTL